MSGKRDENLYIEDMVDAVGRLQHYSDGVREGYIAEDPMRADAILFALTVLGEAAKNVGAETRGRHPEVAWSEIARTRDFVVHTYYGVDWPKVVEIIRDDLPPLLVQLREIIAELDAGA
jgi:uncharacterized protein with HEPN domain